MTSTYDLWTPGDNITSARLNNLERTVIIECTSDDRPTDPTPGMTIFETDTHIVQQFASDTVGWVPPWSMPWGLRTQASNNTRVDAVSGPFIVDPAPIGFNSPQNRLLNIHWELTYQAATDSGAGASPRVTVQVDTGSGLADIGDPGTAGVSPYMLDGVPVSDDYHPAGKTVSYVTGIGATFSFALKVESADNGGPTSINLRGDVSVTRLEVHDMGAWDVPAP